MRSEKQIKAWKRNFTLFVLSGISNRLINLMRLMYKHGYFPNEIVSDNFYDLLKIHRKLEDIRKNLRETKTDQW